MHVYTENTLFYKNLVSLPLKNAAPKIGIFTCHIMSGLYPIGVGGKLGEYVHMSLISVYVVSKGVYFHLCIEVINNYYN